MTRFAACMLVWLLAYVSSPQIHASDSWPRPDLTGNDSVGWDDFNQLAVNFTGDGPSQGKVFGEGDIDGDGDVDTLDGLILFEHMEIGPSCVQTGPAELFYDPATGGVSLVELGSDCPLDVYVLHSADGMLRPEKFLFPITPRLSDGTPAGSFDATRFQIGEINHGATVIEHFKLDLGRVLPPALDKAALDGALTLARYSSFYPTISSPIQDFRQVVLPMPHVGDTDRDGDIDTADLTTLTTNWTGSLEPGEADKIFDEGDFDFDGDIDSADLNTLISSFTGARATMPAAVPEPGGSAVAAVTLLILLARRARGRVVTR